MLWEYLKQHMLLHPDHRIEDETTCMTFSETIRKAEKTASLLTPGRYAIRCRSEMNTGIAVLGALPKVLPRFRFPRDTASCIAREFCS